MTEETRRIPFEEFSNNIKAFFELVVSKHKAFVVEKAPGEVVVVKPFKSSGKAPSRRTAKTETDFEAFRSAAGSWSDFDTNVFIKNMYENRRNSSRPPVRL